MRIVFLMVDSLRADAPGFAGGRCRTPTLDRLAQEGAAAKTALSCSPWTVPSVAAMMTGVYGHRLGLYKWEQPWPKDHVSLFKHLAGSGYRVASFVFDPKHLFRSVQEAGVAGSSQNLDEVIEWLERCTDRNLFLFIHYWGTHFPYLDKPMTIRAWKDVADRVLGAMNADPAAVRPKVRSLYERAVERMSERFLPRLARAAAMHSGAGEYLLLVVSDHGESWGERLAEGARLRDVFDLHGNNLHEESLRVPLLFWGPEWLGGRRVDGMVRTVDIAPTLMELAGVGEGFPDDGSAGIDGASFLASLKHGAPARAPRSVASASADFLDKSEPPEDKEKLWVQFALRTPRWKFLWWPASGKRALFDLAKDPGEVLPLGTGSGEPEDGWRELEAERERSRCAPPFDLAGERLRKMEYIE
ncbi:MAG: sulfatase [Pseudomonadota bacterium]